jgi:hypothetical protein
MNSLADALPPDIARQIHPDWRKNESDYWSVRDQLLGQYQDQWIGFADGAVIASGASPVAVFHAAEASGRNPFVTCVGREDEPTRMRRVRFPYDGSYPGEPLPILDVEFRPASGVPGVTLDRVIADTGADASALPWADCQGLQILILPTSQDDPRQAERAGCAGSVVGRYDRIAVEDFAGGRFMTVSRIPGKGTIGIGRFHGDGTPVRNGVASPERPIQGGHPLAR